MNETPISSKNNTRGIKLYAIFSLVSILIFASFVIGGFFDNTIGKLKNVAMTSVSLINSSINSGGILAELPPFSLNENYSVDKNIVPQVVVGDVVTTQVKGIVTLRAKIDSKNVIFVITTPNNSFSKIITASDGLKYSESSGYYEFNLDTNTLNEKYFYFRGVYANSRNVWYYTAKTLFNVLNEQIAIQDFSVSSTTVATTSALTTSSPSIIQSATNTASISSQASSSASPAININNNFLITGTYPKDLSIFPTILKDNVRIYNVISGLVSFHVEAPGDKLVIFIGTKDGWITDSLTSEENGLVRTPGTNRWTYDFNSKIYKDGNYRLGAAYFNPNRGWISTSVIDFNIANAEQSETTITTSNPIVVRTVTTDVIPASNKEEAQAEVVSEIIKPVEYKAENVVATRTEPISVQNSIVQTFKPVLKLVVNDRQINDLKHTFDSEELELRVTALPPKSVQFFAYAVDGAFKPVLKEIGRGGKDEVLSRDGKEVWTYTTDMREYPTGNFRLFARVTDYSGKILESQSISIVVQHLMQMDNNTNEATGTTEEVTLQTRQNILSRVTDPSACQNRQECEVFCSSSNSAESKCLNFVREAERINATATSNEIRLNKDEVISKVSLILPDLKQRIDEIKSTKVESDASSSIPMSNTLSSNDLTTPISTGRSSLMDILPTPVIENIISVKDKIDVFFPEEINTVSDIQQFCGSVENEIACSNAINKVVPELKDNIEKQAEIVKQEEATIIDMLDKRSGARAYIDTDNDGITDFDEINIYHTNPAKRDTNDDGYSDGASILSQMSPVAVESNTSTSSGKIQLAQGLSVENPKITGSTQKKQFEVISIVPFDFKENNEGKKEISKVALKGIALPNSFVKIYLFSEPLVVTVKTDDSGNWSYILDKTLPDGTHTAYVAMTDGGGRILAKSEPLPFVKEASAITINTANVASPIDGQNTIMGLSPITLIALFIGILGLALSAVGVVIGFKNHDKPNLTLSA